VKKILSLWSYRDLRDGAIFIKPPFQCKFWNLFEKYGCPILIWDIKNQCPMTCMHRKSKCPIIMWT
jgi:hypothetical protein